MISNLNKYLLPTLLIVFISTFFLARNYRAVDQLHPQTLKEPVQTEPKFKNQFKFIKNDYAFTVTPLYDYEISGLIVGKINYDSWYSPYKTDKAFGTDLCLLWGENIKNKVFQNPSLRFSQDQRYCWCETSGPSQFKLNELSNNHLVTNDKKVAEKIKSLNISDQVKIKGQLVDIHAKLIGKEEAYDQKEIRWHSSTTRTDGDAGACEIIYVKELEILIQGNPTARLLHKISLYGLLLLVGLNVLQFMKVPMNIFTEEDMKKRLRGK